MFLSKIGDQATCAFTGRIGNNLFQLANLIAFAKSNNKNMSIPMQSTFWVDGEKVVYDIPFNIFAYDYSMHFELNDRQYLNYFPRVTNYKKHPWWLSYFNVKFEGHFQSYLYFDDIKYHLITKYFAPNQAIKKTLDSFFVSDNSVGISVRRGDYLKLQELHTVLPMTYYQKALNCLESQLGEIDRIYIFSDDLNWCSANFIGQRYTFVEGDVGEQFFKMTLMKNIILSNSSFSWWGAYLSTSSQFVAFPKDWYGPKNKHKFSLDLFPSNWCMIES